MKPDELDSALRARLRGGIDPLVPGRAAEERVMLRLAAEAKSGRRGSVFGGGLRTALVGAAALLVLGGVLGGSMVALHNRSSGGGGQARGPAPAQASPSPSAAPTPSPPPTAAPTPSTAAGLTPCEGATLTGQFTDESGAAGTAGADIVLHNSGSVACTMEGYTDIQGLAGGQPVQLGVTHSVGGTVLNNNNGTLPAVTLVTLQPGADAYVAIEHSDVNSGPTMCPSYTALLVTPPQGHTAVHVAVPGSILLCGGYGASIWIDEAPVSTTAYFKR